MILLYLLFSSAYCASDVVSLQNEFDKIMTNLPSSSTNERENKEFDSSVAKLYFEKSVKLTEEAEEASKQLGSIESNKISDKESQDFIYNSIQNACRIIVDISLLYEEGSHMREQCEAALGLAMFASERDKMSEISILRNALEILKDQVRGDIKRLDQIVKTRRII